MHSIKARAAISLFVRICLFASGISIHSGVTKADLAKYNGMGRLPKSREIYYSCQKFGNDLANKNTEIGKAGSLSFDEKGAALFTPVAGALCGKTVSLGKVEAGKEGISCRACWSEPDSYTLMRQRADQLITGNQRFFPNDDSTKYVINFKPFNRDQFSLECTMFEDKDHRFDVKTLCWALGKIGIDLRLPPAEGSRLEAATAKNFR